MFFKWRPEPRRVTPPPSPPPITTTSIAIYHACSELRVATFRVVIAVHIIDVRRGRVIANIGQSTRHFVGLQPNLVNLAV